MAKPPPQKRGNIGNLLGRIKKKEAPKSLEKVEGIFKQLEGKRESEQPETTKTTKEKMGSIFNEMEERNRLLSEIWRKAGYPDPRNRPEISPKLERTIIELARQGQWGEIVEIIREAGEKK